jgi:hypothetical protein
MSWGDKSDVGEGLITTDNKDHTLHVESDLSSLTATATTSTYPAVAGKRLTTDDKLLLCKLIDAFRGQ